jgi:hypothetical protein
MYVQYRVLYLILTSPIFTVCTYGEYQGYITLRLVPTNESIAKP